MEAGFPAASPDDLEAVKQIAIQVCATRCAATASHPSFAAWRAVQLDIDRCWEAINTPNTRASTPSSPHRRSAYEIQAQDGSRKKSSNRCAKWLPMRNNTATTSNFRQKTPVADPEFSISFSVKRSKAGATTSTFPTPSATSTPEEFGTLSTALCKHARHRKRRRPRIATTIWGWRRLTRWLGAKRSAPGRSDHQRDW